jgi:hypothetical protein
VVEFQGRIALHCSKPPETLYKTALKHFNFLSEIICKTQIKDLAFLGE